MAVETASTEFYKKNLRILQKNLKTKVYETIKKKKLKPLTVIFMHYITKSVTSPTLTKKKQNIPD